jgi:hypothetical protein
MLPRILGTRFICVKDSLTLDSPDKLDSNPPIDSEVCGVLSNDGRQIFTG